jgi:hypothetical protein
MRQDVWDPGERLLLLHRPWPPGYALHTLWARSRVGLVRIGRVGLKGEDRRPLLGLAHAAD